MVGRRTYDKIEQFIIPVIKQNEFIGLILINLAVLLRIASDVPYSPPHLSDVILLQLTLHLLIVHICLNEAFRSCCTLELLLVPLPKSLLFLVKELHDVTGDPEFIIGETENWNHSVPTEVNEIQEVHLAVISTSVVILRLQQRTPFCTLKTVPRETLLPPETIS